MLNYDDIQRLRGNGMKNREILDFIAKSSPSAAKALKDSDTDTKTPDWQKDAMLGNMLDKQTPKNTPSGLPYLMKSNLNVAEKTYDDAQDKIAAKTGLLDSMQGNVNKAMDNGEPKILDRLGADFQKRGDTFQQHMEEQPSVLTALPPTANPLATLNAGGMVGGGLWDVLTEAGKSITNLGGALIPKRVKDASHEIQPYVSKAMEFAGVPTPEKIQTVMTAAQSGLDELHKTNPNVANSISDALNIVKGVIAAHTLLSTGKHMIEGVKGAPGFFEQAPNIGRISNKSGMLPQMTPEQIEVQMKAGKPVPAEEVASYPDLWKKYGSKYSGQGSATTAPVDMAKPLTDVGSNGISGQEFIDDATKQGLKVHDATIPLSEIKFPARANPGITMKEGDAFAAPVLQYEKNGMLSAVDGNNRLNFFKQQGYTEIPVKVIDKAGTFDPTDFTPLGGSTGIDAVEGARAEALKKAGYSPLPPTEEELQKIAMQNPNQKMVQPPVTKKALEEMSATNPERVKDATLMKQPQILPDQYDRQLSASADEIKGFKEAKTPLVKSQLAKKELVSTANSLDEQIASEGGAIPLQESKASVTGAVGEAGKEFGESPGIFDSEAARYAKFRDQFPGSEAGERMALKAYDAEVEKRFGASIYTKGTARAEAVRAVREASHAVSEKAAQLRGTTYLPQIQKMSQMYDIMGSLAKHVVEKGMKSKLGTVFGHPYIRLGATAAGIGLVGREALHLPF